MISQIIPGFIVGLREGLEAFLIISLMLEYLNKLNQTGLKKNVVRGMYSGIGISVIFGAILWLVASSLSNGSSAVAKLWESVASIVAVLFISYFIYWMIKHGSSMAKEIQDSVDAKLSAKGLFTLATVAVAREGAEIALFAFTAEDKFTYLTGTFSGVIIAALLAWLIYKSLVKVNIGLIFKITLIYLILQAGYLAGYGVHELLSALKTLGSISQDSLILAKVYNFKDTILDHKTGVLGIILNVSVGWYSRPEYIQFIVQTLYIITGFTLWKKMQGSKK